MDVCCDDRPGWFDRRAGEAPVDGAFGACAVWRRCRPADMRIAGPVRTRLQETPEPVTVFI